MITQTLAITSSFEEGSQTISKMGRNTIHKSPWCTYTGNLVESFGPAGDGVHYQTHMVSHVSVILRHGDSHINGSLSGSYRHVRCVDHKACSVHDGFFDSIHLGG